MKKQKKEKKMIKERDSEDWCFVCKDGGTLMICDHGDCLKVYHPDCVGKDDSFLETKHHWSCNWHSCLICHNTPKFHCFCCPNAVCGCCIDAAEFAPFRGKKGFCNECLKLVLLAEGSVDLDSDGETIDFNDQDSYEGLFKEYWDIIKEKEGLTLKDVYSADARLKKRENHKCCSNSVRKDKDKEENELIISDSDTDDDIEEQKVMRKRKGSKPLEYMGWGSKPLIAFLNSIGKDATKNFSQCDVDLIITKYIREKNLFHPKKKKKVLCDERLYSIFRKNSVDKNKIYNLLEVHFVENLEQLEDNEDVDEDKSTLGDKNKKCMVECQKQRTLSSDRKYQENEVTFTLKQSSFATIVPDNIKLVYLRRSLVERLLKQPECFENKVVGSFVRIKTNPGEYLDGISHQLLQVRGIEKTSSEFLLQVPYMQRDIHIAMLSDCDFTEEECEDLQQKVKKGLVKKPTVVELELKARILHEDITKHWIERELVTLQNCIDLANEKGWRKELFEYLDKRELLMKPSEQERLLKQEPKVIAEVVELESGSADSSEIDEQRSF